jgi:hypothetical protein
MASLSFKVLFTPIPWKRPSGTVQRFDSQVADKNALGLLIWQELRRFLPAVNKDPFFVAHKPIVVSLAFAFVRPRTSKLSFPTSGNDTDNLAKFVLDTLQSGALAGRIWADDGQVVGLFAEKFFSEKDSISCTIEDYIDV